MTCTSPCASCSQTSPTKCTSCIAGYSFNSATQTCAPIVNCANGVCDICAFGSTLQGGTCLQCNASSNCGRCSTTNTTICTSCKAGQYLENNQCVACQDSCGTCSSALNCLTCAPGYTAQVESIQTKLNCVKCSPPCANCARNPTTCTSCISGFVMKGTKCLSSFNYGFSITLNTTLTTFYSNYQSFLQALASTQSTPEINVTTLTAIETGSVIVQGNVSTLAQSNSNEAETQFNELSNLLTNGGSIVNMPIISSTVDANGGVIPSSSSGPNLAIILGICIPVGVICKFLFKYSDWIACILPVYQEEFST